MSNHQIAFVFPGQGSQSLAMLDSFSDDSIVKQTFEQASDALSYDIWQLISQGPKDKLDQTHRTQPALLTASIALWRLWQQQAEQVPVYVAGHSLGEYSALVASGVIEFEAAVKLVEKRGLLMQEAVPPGAGKMAAIIGLADELIMEACQQSAQSEIVSPVNYNSPGQVVIAGNTAAVERAMQLCQEKGAKRALPLSVSVPSHCLLMQPAAESLEKELNTITMNEPKISVVNNVDVSIETDGDSIKKALIKQLYCPVRWTEIVCFLAKQGVTNLVECGPGNVLSGLAKRTDNSLILHKLSRKDFFNQTVESLS